VQITDRDVEFYRENGYLVIPDLIDRASVEVILAEGTSVCRGERGPLDGLVPSTAEEPDAAVLARYVTCTHVHKVSPLLTEFCADARLADVAERLIGPNVKGIASQFFIKHAGMPGNAWHQDETFVPTRDRSLTTAWIALDAATEENGCLRFVPGSHAAGVLYPMRPHNSPELDRAEEAYAFPGLERAVSIELTVGSTVFFSGYLLHTSLKNRRTSGFRRALLYQYTSAETPIAYHPRNVPVSNYSDNRDFVLVRGVDPYSWKAREDNRDSAFLRAPGPMPEDVVLSDLREREKANA
jgi:ectoine hydroxylase-related dioxygenase (phytanoyl-CoA dioxygenase family)